MGVATSAEKSFKLSVFNLNTSYIDPKLNHTMRKVYTLVRMREKRKAHIIELSLHIAFTIIFLLIIFMQRGIYGSFLMNQGISTALVTQQIDSRLQPFPKTFSDVGSWDELRDYLVSVVGSVLDSDSYYNGDPYIYEIEKASIQYNNILIGGIRLRQLRVRGNSCDVPHQFVNFSPTCYAQTYNDQTRNTEPFGPNGEYKFTESDKSAGVWGYAGEWYEGGGYTLDLPLGSNFTERIQELIANRWYDQATRAVIISLITVNLNLNARMAVTYLIFETKAGGAITPTQVTKMFKVNLYRNAEDYLRGVLEVIFVLTIIYWVIVEIVEFIKKGLPSQEELDNQQDSLKLRWSLGRALYGSATLWNFIEWLNLLGFGATIGMYLAYIASPTREINLEERQYLPQLEVLASNATLYYNISAFNILLCAFRTFKYFRLNARMSYLWSAISMASGDLFSFLVMFLILMNAFLFFGWITFGTDLEVFSTFMNSLGSCWGFVLGNLPDYIMLFKSNRVLGPLFVMMFTIFIVFFMVNMFVAILTDSLEAVRAKKTVEPPMRTLRSIVFHLKCRLYHQKFRSVRSLIDDMDDAARDIFNHKTATLEDMAKALSSNQENISKEETMRVYSIFSELHNVPVGKWLDEMTDEEIYDLHHKNENNEDDAAQLKTALQEQLQTALREQSDKLEAAFQRKLDEQQALFQTMLQEALKDAWRPN